MLSMNLCTISLQALSKKNFPVENKVVEFIMKDKETLFLVEIDKIPHFLKENIEITKQKINLRLRWLDYKYLYQGYYPN